MNGKEKHGLLCTCQKKTVLVVVDEAVYIHTIRKMVLSGVQVRPFVTSGMEKD